jgi:general secretion pathway protein G
MRNGYTLLELLVVLLIFSLLAGLVMPRLTTMYDSLKMAYERDEVFARLGGLGYLAFQQARAFDLTTYPPQTAATDQPPLELPEGWQVRAQPPIHFFASGACSGGVIYLSYQETVFQTRLNPPFCEPE